MPATDHIPPTRLSAFTLTELLDLWESGGVLPTEKAQAVKLWLESPEGGAV